MDIGDILKLRREEIGMTQKELAKDICTQAMISRIEKKLVEPSNKLLEQIAEKLQVPTTYFYKDGSPIDERLSDLEQLVRKHLNKAEYETTHYLVKTNQDLLNKSSNSYFKIFFKWVYAILLNKIEKNPEKAIKQLEVLSDNHDISNDLSSDILSTLAIIYYENDQLDKASKYFEFALNKLDTKSLYKKKVKILYNYSLNLESLNQYKEALETVLEAVDIVIENQSLYMLGYLYFHKAYLLRNLDQYSDAIEAYENAYFVFKILNYEKMALLTKVELKEVKETYEKNFT